MVEFFTDKAIKYLNAHQGDAPFFLKLNYDGPYFLPPTNEGPDPQNPFYAKYQGRTFQPFPPLAPGITEPIPSYGTDERRNERIWRWILNKENEKFQRMHNDPASMANMAAQNEMVDHNVGRLMEALRVAGFEENTLVIFSSDQGNLYGQHGLWGHPVSTVPTFMVDTTFKIPLIFRHVGTIEPKQRADMVVSHYDLIHTLLDYAGFGDVEVANSPGRSFAPFLMGESMPDWPNEVYFEHDESRSVRTNRFFYTKRLEGFGENELYDLSTNPKQTTNVYADPQYANIASELDQKLTVFFDQYADPKYDLWNGGRPKSIFMRPYMFRERYGENWGAIIESAVPFRED